MRYLVCGIILLVGLISAEEPPPKQDLNPIKETNNQTKRFVLSIPSYNSIFYANNQEIPTQQWLYVNPLSDYFNNLQLNGYGYGLPGTNFVQLQKTVSQTSNNLAPTSAPTSAPQVVPQQIVPQQIVPQSISQPQVLPQLIPQQQRLQQGLPPQQISLQKSITSQVLPQQVLKPIVLAQQIIPTQAIPQQIFLQQIGKPEGVYQPILKQQLAPQQVTQRITQQHLVPQQIPQQVVPQQIKQQTIQQQLLLQQIPQQIAQQQGRQQTVQQPVIQQQIPQQVVPQQVRLQQITSQQVPYFTSQQIPFLRNNVYSILPQQQVVPFQFSRGVPLQYQIYHQQPPRPQVLIKSEPYPYEVPPGQNRLPISTPKQVPVLSSTLIANHRPLYLNVPQTVHQSYPSQNVQNLVYKVPAPQDVRNGYEQNKYQYPQLKTNQDEYINENQPHSVYVNQNLQFASGTDSQQQVVRIGYGHPHLNHIYHVQNENGAQRVNLGIPLDYGVPVTSSTNDNVERQTRTAPTTTTTTTTSELKPKEADKSKQ